MVETHFSSDGYYSCVTSKIYEARQAIYTTCSCLFCQKRFLFCRFVEWKSRKRDCSVYKLARCQNLKCHQYGHSNSCFFLCFRQLKWDLKQKSHPYEVYNKSYKVIFSMLGHSHIYFQPDSIRKPSKHSQNIEWNYYITIDLSHILQIEPTWSPCECCQRRRWTKVFGWNATHCLKIHGFGSRKQINQCPCMLSICFKRNNVYGLLIFWAVYFRWPQQFMGLPHLMPIFAGNASLYSSCML